MDHILGLKCSLCGREYRLNEIEYVCLKHGDLGNVDVVYDMRLVARQVSKRKLANDCDYSIWRYRALLPIEPDSLVLPLQIGWTPLYHSKPLGDSLEMLAMMDAPRLLPEQRDVLLGLLDSAAKKDLRLVAAYCKGHTSIKDSTVVAGCSPRIQPVEHSRRKLAFRYDPSCMPIGGRGD
jgi:hypothetical protein